MTVTATDLVTVDVGGCSKAHCLEMGWKIKKQLDPKYSHDAAVLQMDDSFQVYRAERRTARKRADRAHRFGYRFHQINREAYADDIYAINTSMPERQGRPMSDGYHDRPRYGPNPVRCERHHVYTYGVLDTDDTLAAYLWLYRVGDLAMVSTILGHGSHLKNDVMFLLFLGMIHDQYPLGGTVFYNLWSSGQEGLRQFKERVGLSPREIGWEIN